MFKDRFDAGDKLAQQLHQYRNDPLAVIVAIPRGALEIGSVMSRELRIPLDVVLTKKIGAPGNPEYAIGAVSLDDAIIDKKAASAFGDIEMYLQHEIETIRELLKKRSAAYHAQKPPIPLKDKVVIIVDDGIATGQTLLATIELIKKQMPSKIIVAVPVASKEALSLISQQVDQVVCLIVPDFFMSVGMWYEQFDQVDDEQAIALLQGSYQ